MRAHHFALDDEDAVNGDDIQSLFQVLQKTKKESI